MEDISPSLLKKVQTEFNKSCNSSTKFQKYAKAVQKSNVSYTDAYRYAQELGKIAGDAIIKCISSEALPDGKMYYNIADSVVRPILEHNQKITAQMCTEVQTALNKSANINMKAVKVKNDADRANNILNLISSAEQFDDRAVMLSQAISNFTQSVVDDSIRLNAEAQNDAGLENEITRISTGHCCDWCENLAGTYTSRDAEWKDKSVFSRHDNCNCMITYSPSAGKRKAMYRSGNSFQAWK